MRDMELFPEWDQFPESEIHRQMDVLFKAPVIHLSKTWFRLWLREILES